MNKVCRKIIICAVLSFFIAIVNDSIWPLDVSAKIFQKKNDIALVENEFRDLDAAKSMSFQRVPLPSSFPVMSCTLCTHGPTAQLQGQRALRLSLMFQNSTFSVEDIGDVILENGQTNPSFFSERKYGFGLIPTGGRSGNTINNPMVTDVNADNIEDVIGIMFMSYGGSGYGHYYLFAMISQRPESERSMNVALEDVNYSRFGILIDDEVSGVLDFRVRPNHVIIMPRVYRQGEFGNPTGRGEPIVYMLSQLNSPQSTPGTSGHDSQSIAGCSISRHDLESQIKKIESELDENGSKINAVSNQIGSDEREIQGLIRELETLDNRVVQELDRIRTQVIGSISYDGPSTIENPLFRTISRLSRALDYISMINEVITALPEINELEANYTQRRSDIVTRGRSLEDDIRLHRQPHLEDLRSTQEELNSRLKKLQDRINQFETACESEEQDINVEQETQQESHASYNIERQCNVLSPVVNQTLGIMAEYGTAIQAFSQSAAQVRTLGDIKTAARLYTDAAGRLVSQLNSLAINLEEISLGDENLRVFRDNYILTVQSFSREIQEARQAMDLVVIASEDDMPSTIQQTHSRTRQVIDNIGVLSQRESQLINNVNAYCSSRA